MGWTTNDLIKKGLIQVNGGAYAPVSKVVVKKPKKLPNLLKRAIGDSTNKKIKNATKVEYDGIKFDSRLEATMYARLKSADIDFEFQKIYQLQDKFKYGSEHIRAIILTVDFYLAKQNQIIDTKGFQTQQGALRWKLLKAILKDLPNPPTIELPSNKSECEHLINRILYT
jgi:hypothetical protein